MKKFIAGCIVGSVVGLVGGFVLTVIAIDELDNLELDLSEDEVKQLEDDKVKSSVIEDKKNDIEKKKAQIYTQISKTQKMSK